MVHFAEINLYPPYLVNDAAYWQNKDIEACAKELSQILANNINHGGRGIGLQKLCQVL